MKMNMGKLDRIIRIVLGVVIVVLYISGVVSGVLGIVLLLLAGVFFATSAVSTCPVYKLFNLSTRKEEEQAASA